MKKPHVLNRSMFNRGGISAYGRGITSNLVTEEQRQKFNYGGRVRAAEGLFTDWGQGLGKNPWGWQTWDPDIFLTPEQIKEEDTTQYSTNRERQLGVMDLEDPKDYQNDAIIENAKVIETNDKGDVMTDSDWMELLGPTEEQKKRTKGEAQLGLAAGAVDVFSQPTIAKAMKAASPHLLNLGKTATADQKARDKAILQGKVLSKVYTDRAAAKGKADIDTLKWKADLLKTGTPADIYQATIAGEEIKPKTIRDALYTASKGKIRAQTMPADEKKTKALLADPTKEGKFYIQGQDIFIIKNGKFEEIELEALFETLKV
jgi:hypothetical protein